MFALALMSKPMVVMLPVVLILFDIWPLGLKPSVKDKVPLFVLAGAIAAVTLIGQRGAISDALPVSIRISRAIINYSAYLGKTVLPVDLAVLYPYSYTVEMGKVIGSLMLLAAITAGVIALRRMPLIIGWLWYLVTLAPVAGVVQAGPQAIADRFTYIPSIGLLVGLAFGFAWRKTAAIVAGVVAVVFAIMTFIYLGAWNNSVTLFTHTIQHTGPNALAQMKLGEALMDLQRFAEADAAFAEAVRVSNGGVLPLAAQGGSFVRQKRYAEAIAPLQHAVVADPNNVSVREFLGTALMNSGQATDAITHFETALKLDRGARRAAILEGLGDAKRFAGHIDEGIADLRASVAAQPTAEAWNDLGSAYSTKGDLASAEDAFKHAISLKPDFYDARMNYSAVLNRANRNDEAAAQIREAMRIDPKSIEPRIYLALVLAASGKNKEAADAAISARDVDARLANEILSNALQMSPAENNIDAFIARMSASR
jgi:protein O-mannosyl-transferase